MLEKPAATDYPVHELIRNRWSPLAFDPRPIEAEKIGSLLEAIRWAPSSYNEQPWAYLTARRESGEEFQKMLGCLVEANAAWAKNAPLLMIAVASLNFSRNGKPNRHAFHDVGLASENLVLQATSMGLIVHQMAGFNAAQARAAYGIPEGWEAITALAVGYQADPSTLSDDSLRSREAAERSRKPLSEFVFSGKWGQPADLPGG